MRDITEGKGRKRPRKTQSQQNAEGERGEIAPQASEKKREGERETESERQGQNRAVWVTEEGVRHKVRHLYYPC